MSAQIPIRKPNKLKLIAVSTRNSSITMLLMAGIDLSSVFTMFCRLFRKLMVRSTRSARSARSARNTRSARNSFGFSEENTTRTSGMNSTKLSRTMTKSNTFQPLLK